MPALTDYQQRVAEFIKKTARPALQQIADAVNQDAVFSAEVQESETAGGLGRVSLVVRAPRKADSRLVPIFVIVLAGIREGESAYVHYEGEPMPGSPDGKLSRSGTLVLAGVPDVADATGQQVLDHVHPLVQAAIDGYRQRHPAST